MKRGERQNKILLTTNQVQQQLCSDYIALQRILHQIVPFGVLNQIQQLSSSVPGLITENMMKASAIEIQKPVFQQTSRRGGARVTALCDAKGGRRGEGGDPNHQVDRGVPPSAGGRTRHSHGGGEEGLHPGECFV